MTAEDPHGSSTASIGTTLTTTTDGTFIGAMCTGARRRAATTDARLRHRHLRVAAGSGATDCAPCAVAAVLEALESPGSLELLESHGAKAVYGVLDGGGGGGFDIIQGVGKERDRI